MIRLIIYVLVLAALISGAVWFANDPGEVTVLWRGWRIDTSVGILLALMAMAVLVMLGIAKLIAVLRGAVDVFASARKERRLKQGLAALG